MRPQWSHLLHSWIVMSCNVSCFLQPLNVWPGTVRTGRLQWDIPMGRSYWPQRMCTTTSSQSWCPSSRLVWRFCFNPDYSKWKSRSNVHSVSTVTVHVFSHSTQDCVTALKWDPTGHLLLCLGRSEFIKILGQSAGSWTTLHSLVHSSTVTTAEWCTRIGREPEPRLMMAA